ncbi:hypothetical protein [Micromonospora sp. NPDC092111]|uniref:hypothetical protein n=1 Tax=Micromonospora sp. NPDC092111 TaxID=3364289 RepID=UPI00382D50B1
MSVGAELWLIGTPTELDAITRALTAAGHRTYTGPRTRMTGEDAGRYRLYLRLSVTTAAAGRPRPATDTAGGALIDLDAARHQRRPA